MPPKSAHNKMVYPSGCKPINEELSSDDLVRRLKDISMAFQQMSQEDDNTPYIPLAMYLTNDYFLDHVSRDVRLLVACSIADVFRVYAPNAPYQHHDLIRRIFLFFIQQLRGLQDPKDPTFKRYFYLLENLAWVKSFNICFEVEDSQKIFCKLFSLIFKIINDNHSEKVKNFMLDMLNPLIVESDSVSFDLLELILWQIIEPKKSQNKNARWLATSILRKSAKAIEPYIIQYFTSALTHGLRDNPAQISDDEEEIVPIPTQSRNKSNKSHQPATASVANICELIYELNIICPNAIMDSILPQLEFKVKSNDEKERCEYSKLLARLFSDKQSPLAAKYPDLWKSFLGRFRDICVTVRMRCVQYSMHFLVNHPELRDDITEQLRQRLHDPDEIVRHEVVMAIVSAARKDLENVNVDLINFVKERTLDKKFKIRREALYGLAQLYKQYNVAAFERGDIVDHPFSNLIRSLNWIKNKTLHNYFQVNLDDRLLVERIVNTCLIPHSLPLNQRMKNLYTFYCTIDTSAARAFGEMLKQQLVVRKMVKDLLDTLLEEKTDERDLMVKSKVYQLAKNLPEPVKADEFITKLCRNLELNPTLRHHMELIVTATSYQQYTEDGALLEPPNSAAIDISVREVLKSLGFPVQTNSFYVIIRQLMERIAPVLVDHEGLLVLFGYVQDSLLGGGEMDSEMALENSAKRGLQLILNFSNVFPAIFYGQKIFSDFLLPFLWNCEDQPDVTEIVLRILSNIGTSVGSPLTNGNGSSLPWWAQDDDVVSQMVQKFIMQADSPKQAKYAVECLNSIISEENEKMKVFGNILDKIKATGLTCSESSNFRMHLVAIGMISTCGGHIFFPKLLKTIVQKFVVQGLLLKDSRSEFEIASQEEFEASNKSRMENGSLEFCSEEVKAKIEGIKLMVRWLLGLKLASISNSDSESQSSYQKMANNTMQLLKTIVQSGGDLNEKGNAGSTLERANLRLAAGLAMIKIAANDALTSSLQVTESNSGGIIQVTSTTCPIMTPQQWHSLSQLLMDDEEFVRERFATKLHKRLMNLSLGPEFLSMLCLGGTFSPESNTFRQKIKTYLHHNFVKRRDLIKTKVIANVKATMPDCILPYVIHLLAHMPFYTFYDDITQLEVIKECLWFVMEPLVLRNDQFSFSFYKRTLENIKTCVDRVSAQTVESTEPEQTEEASNIATMTNYKIYAACDLALGLVMSKTQNFLLKDFPVQPSLPSKYYMASASDNNLKSYLPPDMQVSPPKRCGLEAEILNKITKSFQAQQQSNAAASISKVKLLAKLPPQQLLVYASGDGVAQEGIVIEDETERTAPIQQVQLTSTPIHSKQRAIIVKEHPNLARLDSNTNKSATSEPEAGSISTVTPVSASSRRKQDLTKSSLAESQVAQDDDEPVSKRAKGSDPSPPAKSVRSTRAGARGQSPAKQTESDQETATVPDSDAGETEQEVKRPRSTRATKQPPPPPVESSARKSTRSSAKPTGRGSSPEPEKEKEREKEKPEKSKAEPARPTRKSSRR